MMLAVMGGYNGSAVLKSVEGFSLSGNTWSTLSEMPDCKFGSGGAVVRDKLYVVGGMDKYGEDGLGYTNSVFMYDPCVDTWSSSIPSMQSTRFGLGVAVLNDRIYAVGGMKTFGDEDGCLETAEVLDMTEEGTQEWKNIASLNNKRGGVGLGVLNGKIFAVGGSCDGRQRFSSVEAYDPETNIWSPVADMSIPRFGAGVGVLNGVLYCVGGQTANPERKNFCTKTVEKYCEDTNTWSQVAEMNHGRLWPGVLTHEGRLYVVGGYYTDGETMDSLPQAMEFLSSMEMYDPVTNTWTLMADMSVGRWGPAVALINKPSTD